MAGFLLPGLALASPRLDAQVSWIGNSFSGATAWVQQDIKAIAVTGDGSVYTNVPWDEAGGEVGLYRDSDAVAKAFHSHGWGYHGGEAIAVNTSYVYFAQYVENEGGGLQNLSTWPPVGSEWYGVSRRLRSDFTRAAPFAGGKGGAGDTLAGCFLLLNETSIGTADAAIAGLCANDQRLYVANPLLNSIQVFDAETMSPVHSWSIQRPGPLALDKFGAVWALRRGDATSDTMILRFSADGQFLAQSVTFPAGVLPSAFCIDSQDRMLVADTGVAQQIRIYTNLYDAPTSSGTFGVTGGIHAVPEGEFGRLRFSNPVGVGTDAAGNIYVAHGGVFGGSGGDSGGGSAVLESYDGSTSQLNWRLFGLEFIDRAEVSPLSDTDVYTKEERFTLDYSKSLGGEWSYRAHTLNRFRYPEDPRLHIGASAGVWMRVIQGDPFLFVLDMDAHYLQIYRFNPETDGETAIPSGLFVGQNLPGQAGWPAHQPATGEWIWRDADGDGRFDAGEYATRNGDNAPAYQGWWVDSQGSVWQAGEVAGIRKFPCAGLDARGNPIWNYSSMVVFPKPAQFDQVRRLRYDAATDTMILGGTFGADTNQHWKPMGPVLCRYDQWSRPTPTLTWRIVAPFVVGTAIHASCEPASFDVAGDYLFVSYTGASTQNGFATGHVEVFRVSNGESVGFMEPSAEIGEIGLQDIRESIRAHRRVNGEYVIFLEDDLKSKNVLYRWRPLNPTSVEGTAWMGY